MSESTGVTETLEIMPAPGPIRATVTVPGSKSLTNRALLIAALADGRSTLAGALHSDDTRYMAGALRALGVEVREDPAGARFEVAGCGGRFPAERADLFAGASGTAARFLTAALTLGHGYYTLDGVPRMRERPIQPLLDALAQLGADARSRDGTGCPPVVVAAHGLPGGTCRVRGDLSSQYLSALLMAGPYAEQGIAVEVEGALVSRPFVGLTAAVMRDFGATVTEDGDRFVVPPGRYRARDYAVEPDATAASYFFAAAAVTGGTVRVAGLGRGAIQGDVAFVDVLARMGCTVERDAGGITVTGPARLRGVEADLAPISDTALTLAAIAPFADGPVALHGLAHTRHQETDRLAAATAELRRLGARVDERPDGLTIYPSALHGGMVATYGDHRMAMSFALIGLRVPGVVIADPRCVEKTFPDFFARFAAMQEGGGAGG
ncbi:MAG TPA: 3-phosphoshikimate 1-carboxyvinyltransferase [Thermomicrobiales bacterium]|nr:3-phosphoshikimate 1-carboxyvinyltransferase [Thermomicrobiales bacterium]